MLVWDNGSTDGTLEELRRWIPSRLPGRIITNEPLSLGNSLARLVEAAETELCARTDADDINYPERLQRQVKFLRAQPEVALLGAQIEFITVDGQVVPGAWKQDYCDAEIRWRLRWQGAVTHSAAMFRRSIGEKRRQEVLSPPRTRLLAFRPARWTTSCASSTCLAPSRVQRGGRCSKASRLTATSSPTCPCW